MFYQLVKFIICLIILVDCVPETSSSSHFNVKRIWRRSRNKQKAKNSNPSESNSNPFDEESSKPDKSDSHRKTSTTQLTVEESNPFTSRRKTSDEQNLQSPLDEKNPFALPEKSSLDNRQKSFSRQNNIRRGSSTSLNDEFQYSPGKNPFGSDVDYLFGSRKNSLKEQKSLRRGSTSSMKDVSQYPTENNPFGSDEESPFPSRKNSLRRGSLKTDSQYPKDNNPFGSDDESLLGSMKNSLKKQKSLQGGSKSTEKGASKYPGGKNPFADWEEDPFGASEKNPFGSIRNSIKKQKSSNPFETIPDTSLRGYDRKMPLFNQDGFRKKDEVDAVLSNDIFHRMSILEYRLPADMERLSQSTIDLLNQYHYFSVHIQLFIHTMGKVNKTLVKKKTLEEIYTYFSSRSQQSAYCEGSYPDSAKVQCVEEGTVLWKAEIPRREKIIQTYVNQLQAILDLNTTNLQPQLKLMRNYFQERFDQLQEAKTSPMTEENDEDIYASALERDKEFKQSNHKKKRIYEEPCFIMKSNKS